MASCAFLSRCSQSLQAWSKAASLWQGTDAALQRRLYHPPDSLKVWKPTSPGQRGRITVDRSLLWKGAPFKPLTHGLTNAGGRTASGRISVWHQGGGHKRLYRLVDFLRPQGVDSRVVRIEYDPNRSARIALVRHEGPEWEGKPAAQRHAYFIAPSNVGVGEVMTSRADAPINPGVTKMLKDLPTGTQLHNIENRPRCGGVLCRSAGTSATLIKNGEDGYTLIALPSGEQRHVHSECRATVGQVSNAQHINRVIGKAGLSRHMGIRPTTRAIATNPCDHPMGGKAKKNRKSPWGKRTMGVKTRRRRKPGSDMLYVTRHAARRLARR